MTSSKAAVNALAWRARQRCDGRATPGTVDAVGVSDEVAAGEGDIEVTPAALPSTSVIPGCPLAATSAASPPTDTVADLDAVDQRVRREVDAATELAEQSPQPEPLDALDGVYADPPREEPLWFREGTRSAVERNERAEGWGTWNAKPEAQR